MLTKAAVLREAGHEVTSRWLLGEDVNDRPGCANKDITDVMEADAILLFAETREGGYTSGGRHVEFGIALAAAKLPIVIGAKENIFHELPQVEVYATWETFLLAHAKFGHERAVDDMRQWQQRAVPIFDKIIGCRQLGPDDQLTMVGLLEEAKGNDYASS